MINEYVEYVNNISICPPYPKGGSTGVYMNELASRIGDVSTGALKLFILIASDINEYGQTTRSRKELAKALKIRYDAKRMSILMNELIDEKWIVMFGSTITVNPNIVLPRVKNVKIKAAIQEAWLSLVEFM